MVVQKGYMVPKKRKLIRTALKVKMIMWFIILSVSCGYGMYAINTHIKTISGGGYLVSEQEAAALKNMDCILVLGCGLKQDGKPSEMLTDRLLTAIALYEAGVAPKLIMSGDHEKEDYDEVTVMKEFAIKKGVPSQDIFLDHVGLSTYDSMFRAREIFCVKKMVVVTQGFHLCRAVYNARKLDMEAYGVSADLHTYKTRYIQEVREVFARTKDYFFCAYKPLPSYLGKETPVTGNGDETNQKEV